MPWPVSNRRVGPGDVWIWRGRWRVLPTWQHEGSDEGGEPSDAAGEQVDHDDPAQAFDTPDDCDHAGQDVQAGQR